MTEAHQVPISSISLDRASRQRRAIPESHINSLAESLSRLGQLQPIIITRKNTLVAGECRLLAAKQLGWETILALFRDEVDQFTLRCIELEENAKRKDLSWQDHVSAVLAIHEGLEEREPSWTHEKTGEFVGFDQGHISRCLLVARALRSGNERVANAETIRAAVNVVQRDMDRIAATELSKIGEVEEEEEEIIEGEPKPKPLQIRPPDKDILCADFLKWIGRYTGPKFNFIHCDLPYGVNLDKSDQNKSATKEGYEDSKEIFKELLHTFFAARDKFISPSAHIMFWFSMSDYEFVKTVFSTYDFWVNPTPLIWLKSDNKGIVSDVERRPRHIYETAFMASRGDRRIIKVVSDAYSAPTGRARSSHISEKPESMLRHFFQMFVDDLSVVLDPTCGSGSALRAAESLGAKRVLGLERDENFVETARMELGAARNLALLEG